MEKELFETLEIIKIFNEKLGSKIISKKEFNQAKKNINEFIVKKEKLQTLLLHIKQSDLNNKYIFRKNLLKLHVLYIKLFWHMEEMHNLIRKLLTNFIDCFPENNTRGII